MIDVISKIKPASFFMGAALFWYLIYFLVMPPFQSPDEYNHLYKAYRVSRGDLLPHQENKRLGGEIPKSFEQLITPFHFSNSDAKSKISAPDVLGSFTIALEPSITEFRDFANTSYYSPVSYLPQSLALALCQALNCSVGTMFYSARLLGFLVWVIVIFYAIRLIPFGKWLLALVNLLPMQLYISNSISADNVTNMLSFLWLAVMLRHAFGQQKITVRALLWLALLGCLLALAKIVYVWLVLLFFLVPANRFSSRAWHVAGLAMVIIPAFLAAMSWSQVVTSNYLSYQDYNTEYARLATISKEANYYRQKELLQQNPAVFPGVFYRAITGNPKFFFVSYVGFFGMYMDSPLSGSLCILAFAAILLVAFLEPGDFRLNAWQRLLLVVTAVFTLAFVFLSQYLTWSKVGSGEVEGIQGRYMIPVLPLVFFLFTGTFKKSTFNLPVFVMLIVFLLNFVACDLLYDRYFRENYKSKLEFFCNADDLVNGRMLTTDKSILLHNKAPVTTTEHLSGTSSVALLNDTSEAFIYRFKGLGYGDWFKVEVWRKGEGGLIDFYGQDTSRTYHFDEIRMRYSGTGDWQLMTLKYIMGVNADSTCFCIKVKNTPGAKGYYDNFHVTVKKYGY